MIELATIKADLVAALVGNVITLGAVLLAYVGLRSEAANARSAREAEAANAQSAREAEALTREAEVMLRLDERWESGEMHTRRCAAATYLRSSRTTTADSADVNANVRLVLNFLEGIVLFVKANFVDESKTEDNFRVALHNYRWAAQSQIDTARVRFDKAVWKAFTDYCDERFPDKPEAVDDYLRLEVALVEVEPDTREGPPVNPP